MNKRNKMKETLFLFAITILLKSASVCAQILPNQSYQMGKASVSITHNTILVNTGKIERQWRWTDHGLLTIALRDVQSNKSFPLVKKPLQCDWNLPGAISDSTSKAKLIALKIREGNDDGFINKYIEVSTTIRYEKAHLTLQQVIWVFPNAPGIRTQLRIKACQGFNPKGIISEEGTRVYYGNTLSVPSGQSAYLPLDLSVKNQRRYWGYYNDPGARHDQSRDMLKEQVVLGYPVFQDEDISWASGVSVDYGDRGVMLVKESPKCVNQQGHNTGSFYTGPQGVKVTGWGLKPSEFVTDRFRECWATWTILYTKGNDGMQFALKQFDRIRYPVFPERDEMIINDTWGPANPGGQQFAKEAYLLKEIPLLADLGIDVLRIDDGWQKNPWKGDKEEFLPRYEDG
ncbi:MAG: hypothetical protein M0P33_05285, partial [Massilibacteroides sp.]|nr:hypothetical protein [Massilibacteroides sp.]